MLDEEEQRFKRTVRIGLDRLEKLVAREVLAAYSDNPEAVPDFTDPAALIASALKERDQELWRTAVNAVRDLAKALEQAGTVIRLKGADIFTLYDTYGLSRDFIEDTTRDARVQVDWNGFEVAMQEQRTRAKASWKGRTRKRPARRT
jgi:alanyl-tRNA synthetase